MSATLNREEWMAALERLAGALPPEGPPLRLCLLGDIRFLVSRHRPDLQRVREIVAGFEPHARERASENLVYLEVFKV